MIQMQEKGIVCRRPVFKPLHRYLNLPGYAVTDQVWSNGVSIPIYPSLTEIDADRIVDAIKTIL